VFFREPSKVQISKLCEGLKNLDDSEDINKVWETINGENH